MIALIAAAALAGTVVDATGSTVTVTEPARVVSLGGTVTETVWALGLGEVVVGVDQSSIWPEAATKLPHVGYYRALGAEGVLSLTPDLVLLTEEAGPPEVLAQLRSAGIPLAVLPAAHGVEAALERIRILSTLLDRPEEGQRLARALQERLATVRPVGDVRVAFVFGRGAGALTIAGANTAADAMIGLVGAKNAVTSWTGYRPLTAEAMVAARPDVLLTTTRILESVGGIDGLLAAPGVALTPAGRARRVVALDDLLLLGFGPRTGEAAVALAEALR